MAPAAYAIRNGRAGWTDAAALVFNQIDSIPGVLSFLEYHDISAEVKRRKARLF